MSATDTIRIRLEPQLKNELQEYCAKKGTTISQEIRDFLNSKLQKQATALERFDVIMASAEQKLESSGLPEPTIDELNAYISHVRSERREQISKAS
jgi:antitoxin component of RelBE/YafQ-DinJ toxin-antitoxin module